MYNRMQYGAYEKKCPDSDMLTDHNEYRTQRRPSTAAVGLIRGMRCAIMGDENIKKGVCL